MNKKLKQRAIYIQNILEELYPKTPIPLKHKDAYTLLVAVVLSAQCTDKMVNRVTPELFSLADNPKKMIKASIEQIRDIIKPCGLSNNKSKAIWNFSKMIIDKFNGEVPSNFEDLESLSGVGHKTASVIMSQAFNQAAFPVDTHIHRLAHRWGLSNGKNVVQTEKDLKKIFPKEKWNKLHLQMIFFGREYCTARGHEIEKCPICSII